MKPWLPLAALLVLVGSLHALGLSTRLPWAPGNDEHVYAWHQRLFDAPTAERAADPAYRYYPHLVSRLASLLPVPRAGEEPGAPTSVEREHEIAGADYWCARAVVAALALLVLPATWSIGRRLGGERLGLLGSALSGTSVLFAWYACEARPHAAFAGLACAAIALVLRAQQRGGASSFLLAGLATGLAIATLQSGVFLLLPLAVAHFARPRAARRGGLRWLVASFLLVLAVALPFHPFLWTPVEGAEQVPRSLGFASHHIWLEDFDGSGFAVFALALWDHEPVILLVVLAGLCALLAEGTRGIARAWRWASARERRAALLVVLAFAAPYTLVFGAYGHTYPRFLLPLVPFAALCAAGATIEIAERSARPRLATAVASWIVFLAALAPTLRLAYLQSVPDTSEQAGAWLEAHADREHDEIRVLASLTLPLVTVFPPHPAGLPSIGWRTDPWRVHQARIPEALRREAGWRLRDLPLLKADPEGLAGTNTAEYVRRLGADYVVLETWDRSPLRELRAWLREHAVLVARCAPAGEPPEEKSFLIQYLREAYSWGFNWVARSFRVERLGTVIEIYRLTAAVED